MNPPGVDESLRVHLAYIIGVALGDGNLSRPNKRATRLRVTCDSKYGDIANEIMTSLKVLFPTNKVSVAPGQKSTYFNISVYSNKLDDYLPWKVGCGPKYIQDAHVPDWILIDKTMIKACLKGLLQTDGSIYIDRGYIMVNFVNTVSSLAYNAHEMMEQLGYHPRIYSTPQKSGKQKYTVRLAKNALGLIKDLSFTKS